MKSVLYPLSTIWQIKQESVIYCCENLCGCFWNRYTSSAAAQSVKTVLKAQIDIAHSVLLPFYYRDSFSIIHRSKIPLLQRGLMNCSSVLTEHSTRCEHSLSRFSERLPQTKPYTSASSHLSPSRHRRQRDSQRAKLYSDTP